MSSFVVVLCRKTAKLQTTKKYCPSLFLVILISLRSPMELTENDIRDLILMNSGARDGGGESSEGGGAREASSGGGAGGGGGEGGGVDSHGEVKAEVEMLATV